MATHLLSAQLSELPRTRPATNLCNHHVAIKHPLAPIGGALHTPANARHDWRADGDVRDEVPVHDVDVQPVGAGVVNDAGAFVREVAEVGGEDGGGDDGFGRHCVCGLGCVRGEWWGSRRGVVAGMTLVGYAGSSGVY